MELTIKTKIKQARLKMFRKDVGLMLFGACAYKFNWNVTNMSNSVEGGVCFDIKTKNVEDGNIHINEYYIKRDDYTYDNLVALITHELIHILQKHGQRRKNRDNRLYNFAADHVVDRDLKELDLNPYKNRFNIIPELHNENPKCTVEQAYDWIYNRTNRFSIKSSGDDRDDGDNTVQGFTVTDEKTGEKYEITNTPDNNSELSQEASEKLKQKVEQFVSEARAQNQIMRKKGMGSGKIQEYLDKLLEVKINWEDLLEKAIKTNTILKPNQRNWRRIHPYYQLHGLTLPGRSMEEEKENVGLLILLLDVSASINKKELRQFGYVLNKSIGYFDTILLLTHDYVIQQNVEFQKEDHGKFFEFLKKQGFKGGGSTSHRDCFEYIEKEIWSDNEKRDVLSMVISLTDGYSDIENLVDKYNWIKNNTPLVFMSTSGWKFKDEKEEFKNISNIQIT